MGRGRSGANKEDRAQLRGIIYEAATRGTKYYEYTDSKGRKIKGETAQAFSGEYRERVEARMYAGGTTKGEYSKTEADYAKMSTAQLESELKRAKGENDTGYWAFSRQAGSRGAGALEQMGNSQIKINLIRRVLLRRNNKMYNNIKI